MRLILSAIVFCFLAVASHAQGLGYNVSQVSSPYVSSVNGQSGAVTIPSNFISGYTVGSPGLTSNLLSGSPCASGILGQYAVVSDLYSGASATNEVMRCSSSGSTYYWRPQRTDFATATTSTGGSSSLTCLVSAPSIFYSGTLTSNLSVNLSNTNCWPGARFDIASNLVLGIFGLNVTGLNAGGGGTKGLPLNAHYTFIYIDSTNGWQYYQ